LLILKIYFPAFGLIRGDIDSVVFRKLLIQLNDRLMSLICNFNLKIKNDITCNNVFARLDDLDIKQVNARREIAFKGRNPGCLPIVGIDFEVFGQSIVSRVLRGRDILV
jgi:hypothetical protein